MKIKILGISGTPRKEGNTTILVNRALETCKKMGAETVLIELAEKEIIYCDNCNACQGNDHLCSKKDGVAEILEEMQEADAIIIGSPTYFCSVSGQLKTLFDRTLPLRRNNFRLAGKVGGAIAVGGSRNGGQENVIRDIHNWMLVHGMLVVSDRKTAHFGGIAVARNPGDVLEDEIGLATTGNLAEKVVETVERMKGKD